MWLVQAAHAPTHWIFQLSHGDILISPVEQPESEKPSRPTLLASKKTIAHLQKDRVEEVAAVKSDDPWMQTDPWKKTPDVGMKEISVGQMNSLQQRVEASLLQKLKGEDVEMSETDNRVSQLEQKVEQLSQAVATQGQTHTQHVQHVQQQLDQHTQGLHMLDAKVEKHQQNLTATLTSKLDEQMLKMEQLILKRARTE